MSSHLWTILRPYDTIEAGIADMRNPALNVRIEGLKAICDQAWADGERVQAMPDNASSKAITPQMIRTFAKTAPPSVSTLKGTAIAATICAHSPSASRSPKARFGS
jgi:hypothetical protein